MKRLVAIESPIRAVAIRVASMKSLAPGPAAASIESFSVLAGKARSGWRVNSPVMVSCVLTIAFETPAHLAAWQVSAERAAGLASIAPYIDGPAVERGISGLAHWFQAPAAVRPGDVLTATGIRQTTTNKIAFAEVTVRNQDDVIVGHFRGTVYRTHKPLPI